MKKHLFFIATMFAAVCATVSCQKVDEPVTDGAGPVTRAFGDKTPKTVVYVETNDTNPLNAGDYTLADGKPYADIVELFASNIHKRTVNGVVEPTLYLNDKMTNLLENNGYLTYVKPLQDKGIKVLLTVLGDWQDMGLANMNSTQTTQFARILCHAVEKYGLDGIGFDDEYANYSYYVNTSYSEIITKLRALFDEKFPNEYKLITVFDWGNTGQINTTAARAAIDYAYHGSFSASYFDSTPGIGLDKARWSPLSINLGNSNSTSAARSNAKKAKDQGFGAIMTFNMRRASDYSPLGIFNAIAGGAYGSSVTCSNGDRPQDWTFISTGHTLTIDDVQ